MGGYFGIDFGTTNTAVAYITEEASNLVVEMISDTKMPFSSLLAIPKDRFNSNFLFGRDVKSRRQQLAKDHHIYSSFKSKLGSDDKFRMHGHVFTPIQITAIYLDRVKKFVKEKIGVELKEATFAIPVDFTPEQRRDLKYAAKESGIKVNRFISESTAAYLRNLDEVKGLENVVVFDWGGGTLDISVLNIKKSIVSELSVHGKRIGGDDIDRLIAQRIHARIAQTNDICEFDKIDDVCMDNIIVESEKAKERLSYQNYHRFQLIDYVNKGIQRCELTYQDFSDIVNPIIEDAIKTLFESLDKAKLPLSHLDAIIMVGGSCDMGPLRDAMLKLFEDKKIKLIYPENKQWSVAVGAAIVEKSDTTYRLSNEIGIVLSDESIFPIFEKNSGVPQKIEEIRFGLVEDSNDAHFVIADGNRNILKNFRIPTKGFTSEGLVLNAIIDEDMIGRIFAYSTHMPKSIKEISINKIGFYYDIGNLVKPKESI